MGNKRKTSADTAASKLLVDKPRRKEKSEAYLKYQRYIKSKEFKAVREKVLERDHYTCQCCNWSQEEYDAEVKSLKRTLTCHHKTYAHLYDELDHLEDCITLCNCCHIAIHRSPSNHSRFNRK